MHGYDASVTPHNSLYYVYAVEAKLLVMNSQQIPH